MKPKTQYTPGPWTVHNVPWIDEDKNTVRPVITDATNMEGQRLIATVRVSAPRQTDGEANARLIAAAPALLEALKDLLEYAVYISEPVDNVEKKKARVAIRQAEGE